MPIEMKATLHWIREEFGGRTHQPFVGYRPTIRLQRDVSTWLSEIRDVRVVEIALEAAAWQGFASLIFAAPRPSDAEIVNAGDRIELLEGDRVVAVGVITFIEDKLEFSSG
jgi:hypothetical protein